MSLLLEMPVFADTTNFSGATVPWKAAAAPGGTGTILRHDAFASKFVEGRNVHVWLPPSYRTNSARRYPVLYANDGQNLFDPTTAVNGVDWAMDETMTRLIAENKVRDAIIVAVWNTPQRIQEYVPEKAVLSAFGTERETVMRTDAAGVGIDLSQDGWRKSDAYLKFLVQELKPFIDREYRTRTNRDDTFILGSSAGGLISLYAISEYPEVFGGAACLSTHWPPGGGVMVDYFKDKLPAPATHKLYFDFGTLELDQYYEPFQLNMDAALAKAGYRSGTNWLTRKFTGDDHTEKAWGRRAHVPLEFLLGK